MKIFSSKVPLEFTEYPLNVAFDVQLKTNLKLNLDLEGRSLIPVEESEKPEYHLVRYEGHIAMF